MQIFVRLPNEKTNVFDVIPETRVEELKEAIQMRYSIDCNAQRILYCGRPLDNQHCLNEVGITNLSTVDMVMRCRGGAFTENDKLLTLPYQNSMICRVCYATNSPKATHCRKKMCGHSTKLRPRKKLKVTGKK
ncbi:Ubiquitin-60S ribosomal protein L40 [Astathelohania contejeani]|uniref:Ubiquitin-60S ribosomal protein L40 n=1 Tax=Astathelohania contejeani TaxID=164912 RepID=A0ABQ7HXX0_9MICR|nr:Ubiquitin-60S ribosomal protein L40 [Thelohania contejeani]